MPPSRAPQSPHEIRRLRIPADVPADSLGQGDIATLHSALRKMKLTVDTTEVGRRQIGATTVAAIKALQARNGLPQTGVISAETVAALKADLEHRYYAGSKTRTERLQAALARLGHPVSPEEIKRRAFGPSTQAAIKAYQQRLSLPHSGDRITEELVTRLTADALAARFTTKTQVGKLQRALLRASRIGKLQLTIDRTELKGKTLGPTTKKAIETFQKEYALTETGDVDVATVDRLVSVASSRTTAAKKVRVPAAEQLAPVRKVVRLNSTSQHVADLQRALAFLGHPIDRTEYDGKTFGRTTRQAVIAYQRAHGLPVTGHAEATTLAALNAEVATANPQTPLAYAFRVRGSVRNNLWQGRDSVKVQVWEKPLRGEGRLLAERRTLANGFFDVPYLPPVNLSNGQVKATFHLQIKFIDAGGTEVGSKVLFNPTMIAWSNLTDGNEPYRGPSEYETRMAAVARTLGTVALSDIEETDDRHEVTHLALDADLSQDDVMRLVLAERGARSLNVTAVTAPVLYAFLRQNLPPALPSELLASTEAWTLITQLVDRLIRGIVFMDADLQAQAFDAAVKDNLIPIVVGTARASVLGALNDLKRTFALEQPMLVGNGNLRSLLTASSVPAAAFGEVATAFLRHGGLGDDFWTDLGGRANEFGGAQAIADFQVTVDLGHITKNHVPTVAFLRTVIADPARPAIKSARDLAKLTPQEWVGIIEAAGGVVPEGTDGTTPQERIAVYASTLAATSARVFPTVAFVAEAARSTQTSLTKLTEVQQFVDQHEAVNLRTTNLEAFIANAGLTVAPDVLAEARALQRVHRLAATPGVGRALLEQGIHHSAQVIRLGKEGLVNALAARNIDKTTALRVHAYAEFQYAQVLMRLGDYRFELHQTDPAAIIAHTYTPEEQQALATGNPTLATLFGSQDFCECTHCQSVYGPGAYLTDVLRFLDAQPSETAGKTVRGVLFDRRPDIGNIKLNCDNALVPLPYIDLVCEILEAAVPNPAVPDFSFQTTRTAQELEAFPQNVRTDAYDHLKSASFPMTGSFNLWQEEARVLLNHLGVARHDLMKAFQTAAGPTDTAIAGEFWGLSTKDTETVTTAAPTTAAQDDLWGFDTTGAKVPVSTFLAHARIEYVDLLSLLAARWVNSSSATPLQIERPDGTCSLDLQLLANVTADGLDRMARFLRLWRRTSWKMWELDLLIRAPRLGAGTLDAASLVALQQARQLQDRLRLGAEEIAGFFGTINTEARVQPEEPNKPVASLYATLFQNPAGLNPLNPAFALPLSGVEALTAHRPTLLAALALTDADLTLLIERTPGGTLTLDNLTRLANLVALARGLAVPLQELVSLIDLVRGEIPDVFASPGATLDFIVRFESVKSSGFTIQELDYILNPRATSPFGLRDEVVTQHVESLRDARRAATPAQHAGQIASQVASVFSLADEQARILVQHLTVNAASIVDRLSDPRLTERDGNDQYRFAAAPAEFPEIYDSYRLLHKVSLLVTRLKIASTDDLLWLVERGAAFQGLDFSTLPLNAAPAQPLFAAWLSLRKWVYLRRLYAEPEQVTLRGIFDAAANPATPIASLRADVSALTGWSTSNLEVLDAGLLSGYGNLDRHLQLRLQFSQLTRLGVDATLATSWAERDADTASGQFNRTREIRETVKSKYAYPVWLAKVKPLQDDLREKKRTALTSYLVERSLRTEPKEISVNGKQYANPRYWNDANDLLGYFLIDVEMSSAQATSRIKQAMSSVQMFTQRAFLNLEQPEVQVSRGDAQDTVSLNSWRQWRWMKSYRIWEANRKVFLYPENWLEPELRDDKSPFFKELEQDILQGEATDEHCEAAFQNYLEKVNEVSRLEVAGIYHQIDEDDPADGLPPNINLLHVVGRTRSEPAAHYYRQLDLNTSTWTAWEKIDLDIASDHVVPVVYNRKLHLFWLVLTDKPQKVRRQPPAKPSDTPTDVPDGPRQVEIQLAWSVRRDNGWSPRLTAPHKLIHPWQRPHFSYNLKPRYKSRENQLWMDLYISTSQAFNNTAFYDPYTNTRARVTASAYDETGRPWHASSFVFADSHIVATKVKPLRGRYHLSWAANTLVSTDSYEFMRDQLETEARAVDPLVGGYEIAPRLLLPDGMHFENTRLTNNKVHLNPGMVNVLESTATRTLLGTGQRPFEVTFSPHHIQFDTAKWETSPLFYQDTARAFFIKPEWRTVVQGYNETVQRLAYTFYPFYHPYAALFLRELNRTGVDGVLNRRLQQSPQTYYPGSSFDFAATYHPAALCAPDATAATETVDFSRTGAFAVYNWELFFHAPFLVACRLSQNQRFEEAMRWFHYIFDPTNTESLSVPQRYWVTRPFFEQNSDDYRKARIENLLNDLGAHLDEVRAWKNNPFKPHLIARYRPVAYQKAVVMKYIDNLIAWGDQLFRGDTMEQINEATLLYVLAYELLGPRPVRVPDVARVDKSYNELAAEAALDPLGDARVEVVMENYTAQPTGVIRTDEDAEPLPSFSIGYFGIPANDNLLSYWTTIEDRLFKIRHSMNIEGLIRKMPLFEPPIDPALLVKAAEAGIDVSSVLSEVAATTGPFRFRLQAARAAELCGDVRALGDKILNALQQLDAEGIALLRSAQEIELLSAVKDVKTRQIDEARASAEALERSLETIDKRIEYYGNVPRMNAWEVGALTALTAALGFEAMATIASTVAGTAHLFPQIQAGAAGFGGSPTMTLTVGGDNTGKSSANYAALFQGLASIVRQTGQMLETQGAYRRRDDENKFQADLARAERTQVEMQLQAARFREALAEQERDNHDLQLDQTRGIDEYLHSKYTNQQLFDWMLRQLSTVYFRSYQLAYDMARRAQKSFQLELGDPAATFVQFGYWDSLKKGLLAGEKLSNDLRRMESAYFERCTRELEITKHISLAQCAPLSLLALKEAGACTVRLPEWLFDLDYPGHYRRRIKSVSITVPCIVGPYTSVNCTVTMTNNAIRVSEDVTGGYGDPLAASEPRFVRTDAVTSAIATSHGQFDSGVFELNFNDERYLPFEGAGAVSEWQIGLPRRNNQFDVSTISDVILHVRYTAIPGGAALVSAANANLNDVLPATGMRLLDLQQEFGSDWYRFLHPPDAQEQVLSFRLGAEHLPFYIRARAGDQPVRVTQVDLVLESPHSGQFDLQLQVPGLPASATEHAGPDPAFGGMHHLQKGIAAAPPTTVAGDWTMKIKKDSDAGFTSLQAADIGRAYLVIAMKIG